MKRKFAKLLRKEQEKVESQYHRMTPKDFDETMSGAVRQSPNAERPTRLVKKLKTVATRHGEHQRNTQLRNRE